MSVDAQMVMKEKSLSQVGLPQEADAEIEIIPVGSGARGAISTLILLWEPVYIVFTYF